MGNGIWLIFGLVELFGVRLMLKKFQVKWDPQSCTCFTMLLCCIQTLGIYRASLAWPLWLKFGTSPQHGQDKMHKKFGRQWANINNTSFRKCHSALKSQTQATLKL